VAKIDTACKSNISIFAKKITKILVLTWESSRLNDCILILLVLSSSSERTNPLFQYQLFVVHVLQEIVIINSTLLVQILYTTLYAKSDADQLAHSHRAINLT
jgi:hypothetical protein